MHGHHGQEEAHDPSNVPSMGTTNISTPARVIYGGVTYSRSSTHLGNSLIQFYPNGDQRQLPVVGEIEKIEIEGGKINFVVHRQQPAEIGRIDPFGHYPHLTMKLYSTDLAPEAEQVSIECVLGHIARCTLNLKDAVILLLNKVSLLCSFNILT